MSELLPPASLRAELRRQRQAIWQLTVQQAIFIQNIEYLVHQMKYDASHGRFDGTIEAESDLLVNEGQKE
eukprot:14881858-Alexandrium_andersonii.AAC.1